MSFLPVSLLGEAVMPPDARPSQRTPCERSICGRPYISHRVIENPQPTAPQPPAATTSMVPSRAPSAQAVWGVPPGSTNGRRKTHAAHASMWGSSTGASFPRGQHRPFQTTTNRVTTVATPTATYIPFAIYPLPMDSLFHDNVQYPQHPELYPTQSRIHDTSEFYLRAQKHNLTFSFRVPTPDTADDATEAHFYSELGAAIHSHAKQFGLVFPSNPSGARHISSDIESPAWHAMQLIGMDWSLVKIGNKPRQGQPDRGRILSPSELPYHLFTVSQFKKLPALTNPLPHGDYHLIAPKHGPLRGPPEGMAGPHLCFPLRFLYPLVPFSDPVQCYPSCTDGTIAAPAQHPGPLASGSSRRASHQRIVLDQNAAAVDSDEEEAQMNEAIARSMLDAPNGSSSGPVAGPSRPSRPHSRPLPALPPVRPRSTEITPPPALRRRLNPTPIDLTQSPPPTSRPKFRSPRLWANSIEELLTPGPSRVSASTTEEAVTALLSHFHSFFGGESYAPADADNAVLIEPSGRYDFLARSSQWTVGDAIGNGVFKNTMTELMNLIFADNTIWKQVDSGCVIDTTPPGIPADPSRICRLRTYGFVCMLYVVLEHSLPVPMSMPFAYALLQRNGDAALIEDMQLLRAAAPGEARLLREWPLSAEDFVEQKDNKTLQGLTPEFFNKMPEVLATSSAHTLEGYRVNAFRQVLFGSATPFSESEDIQAFLGEFNGRLSASSTVTLGETFGGSLRSLMPMMSARRLKSPEDLIDRLQWTPSGLPGMLPVEQRYKVAMVRYLRGKGIVHHRLFPTDNLTDAEKNVEPNDPCARALMFLLTVTGTLQLPKDNKRIEVNFIEKYESKDLAPPESGDPVQNPDEWPDKICPVIPHTCFDGVDCPLLPAQSLLAQPLPDDDTCTDFDLFQYLMYRPITRFAEFGGIA
ncbi:hypothetical protein MVEN_02253700 [Mycena venus]|uniref:Uncharacterized protein n=1 Tax=Mycena venus TaxID=2733690 RepID=A0A8H7CF65_9AGAR|nr:hypothetical protein MVEN_02253700 [Mycena venus]